MFNHIVVIALTELDLQQIERYDRCISRHIGNRFKALLGGIKITPRVIDIGFIIGRMRSVGRIFRALLKIGIGLIGISRLKGRIPRTEIVLILAGIGQLVGVYGQQMLIGLFILAILFENRSQSEVNIVQIDRIGIILDKTFEQITGTVLLPFCRTQCNVIAGPHPIAGIVDRHHLQSLLKFDQRRTILLTLIELDPFVIVVLRPTLHSVCWAGTYARHKQSRRYQPFSLHIVKYLTL